MTIYSTDSGNIVKPDYVPHLTYATYAEISVNKWRTGDIVYCTDTHKMMLNYSSGWIQLASTEDRPQVAVPTNCKNCGAPLHGRKCEYCGTEY